MNSNSISLDEVGRPRETNRHAQPNRLIREKSPYLLQHAHNPVDWYPWGDEAFDKAKQEGKPVFLSIGYSTCHWCHVMERESFEDENTARLMNETFVSIKVDREERPDLDHIYMAVCQMITGAGGWPLNVVMTPDKKPFFAGTYFPRESRQGRMGMKELCLSIEELWKTRHNDVLVSAGKVMAALKTVSEDTSGPAPDLDISETAFRQLAQRYDPRYGGFSQAPKFPTPHNMFFLLRYWKRTGDVSALEMVEKTLQFMHRGGIYDHLGFGFHRYSTDEKWIVPHFEKMLYDQALISMAYIEAFQASGNEEYAAIARECLNYVLRDMTSPEGGFYSAEDADSEGEEGKFYVWTTDEIRSILEQDETDLITRVYDVLPFGNYHEEATRNRTGTNILHLRRPLELIAADMGLSVPVLRDRLYAAGQKLFRAREDRVHPLKDDKIITDWNGLMIAALARGAQTLGNEEYAPAARRAADFILTSMMGPGGILFHRYRQGEVALAAHADDYAFLIWGLLELYEATFEPKYLRSALDLNASFVERFWDDDSGAFFFASAEAEDLIVRKKEIYDGATPSGNSVAAMNLLRLSRATGDPELAAKAEMLFRVFSGAVRQFPSAYTHLLCALEFALGESHEIVIAGRRSGEDTREMLTRIRTRFLPNKVVLLKPSDEASPEIAEIAPFTAGQEAVEGRATAYVCRKSGCELPTRDPVKMMELIGELV